MLTSSEVLTERKSFETVVRSVLPGGVDPRVVSVVLGLLLSSMGVGCGTGGGVWNGADFGGKGNCS